MLAATKYPPNMNPKKNSYQLPLALSPLLILMLLLWLNVGYVYGDDALSGSNQVILLLSALIAEFGATTAASL